MVPMGERTPAEWYEEAARWYIEGHQACPCCDKRHCVFRSESGNRVEYYCSACDFSTCCDQETGLYYATTGEKEVSPSPSIRGVPSKLWAF